MPSLIAKQLIEEEEGRKAQPYYDSRGYVTWGVGHLSDPRLPCPVPAPIVDAMFSHDLAEKTALARLIKGFTNLNEVQQTAVISMVFQLGFEPFDGDGFKDFTKFLTALAKGDVKTAAAEGLDSKWAKADSPRRAQRQMKMLATGLWVPKEG
jgi:GH24 family phage-related lysozyme (muramidase)